MNSSRLLRGAVEFATNGNAPDELPMRLLAPQVAASLTAKGTKMLGIFEGGINNG